jgi:hypothetical protein
VVDHFLTSEAVLILTTTAPSPDKTWNLSGHDANDCTHNVVTPDDWYSFEAKTFAKVVQEQEERGTNYCRILDEAGGYEEPVEREQEGKDYAVLGCENLVRAAMEVGRRSSDFS